MAVNGGRKIDVVHRMNLGYKAWRVLKIVLRNNGLGIMRKGVK